jgi:hypothetical protein
MQPSTARGLLVVLLCGMAMGCGLAMGCSAHLQGAGPLVTEPHIRAVRVGMTRAEVE